MKFPKIKINLVSDVEARRLAKLAKKLNKRIDDAYMIIATNIRQKAKRSIKQSSNANRHSQPGQAVRTMTQVYKRTVERDYKPAKKTLVVGPKLRGFYVGKDGAVPSRGETTPHLLEYGGYLRASKMTFIHKSQADRRAVAIAWKKQRQAARMRKRRIDPTTGKPKRFLKGRDFKWVMIPPGTRKVDPRPTMRLAFNQSVNQRTMEKHFRRIGSQLAADGTLNRASLLKNI